MIDSPAETGTRLYEAIPDVYKYREHIKARLESEIPVPPLPVTENWLVDSDEPSGDELALAIEVDKPENRDKVRDLVVECIEMRKELEQDVKTAQYLLTMLSKAASHIGSAISNGLHDGAVRNGVEQQLDDIEQKITHIRNWLRQ